MSHSLAGASDRSMSEGLVCFTVATDAAYPERRLRARVPIRFASFMARIPSASYSLTMRVEIPSTPGSFASVAGAIAEAEGDVGAIDLVRVTRDHTVRDITVSAADS